jgi:hypothetical protein
MSAQTDPRVKPHVRAAAQLIANTFGITDIGGFATTGHISDSDHYKGLAIDVMTTTKGREVSSWAVQNAKQLCITYVIWNRQIWDSRDGKGWVPYHGTSPHTDHVHISFFPTCDSSGTGGVVNASFSSDLSDRMGCLNALKSLLGL